MQSTSRGKFVATNEWGGYVMLTSETAANHNFGGIWTLLKLEVLQSYLSFFTTALKNQGFKLVYIDAFAGSGSCTVTLSDEETTVDGSASIALETSPQFHELLFIEKDSERFEALSTLATSHPNRKITLRRGDANQILPEWMAWREWHDTRGVLFLDPYGMSTEWSLLKQISETKAIDLWYLFPLSAFFRQAAIDFRRIDESKAAALTKMVGTADWHSALYSTSPQAGLFDEEPSMQRHADTDAILDFVTKRLKTVFPHVEKPWVLRQDKNRGAPLFALYFAVSNPDPKAIGLAQKVAQHILGKAKSCT